MSYYGDDYEEDDMPEPEPVTPPVVLPLPAEVTVPITVYATQMQDQIMRQVAAQVTKLFEAKVAESVESAVNDLVNQIAREHIEQAVRDVLAEGWTLTNEYGEGRGKASLKDRISTMLNNHDRYSGRGTFAATIVKEETEKALRGELKDEIEKAKAQLRAEVDGVTRAKLNEALRSALGVGA